MSWEDLLCRLGEAPEICHDFDGTVTPADGATHKVPIVGFMEPRTVGTNLKLFEALSDHGPSIFESLYRRVPKATGDMSHNATCIDSGRSCGKNSAMEVAAVDDRNETGGHDDDSTSRPRTEPPSLASTASSPLQPPGHPHQKKRRVARNLQGKRDDHTSASSSNSNSFAHSNLKAMHPAISDAESEKSQPKPVHAATTPTSSSLAKGLGRRDSQLAGLGSHGGREDASSSTQGARLFKPVFLPPKSSSRCSTAASALTSATGASPPQIEPLDGLLAEISGKKNPVDAAPTAMHTSSRLSVREHMEYTHGNKRLAHIVSRIREEQRDYWRWERFQVLSHCASFYRIIPDFAKVHFEAMKRRAFATAASLPRFYSHHEIVPFSQSNASELRIQKYDRKLFELVSATMLRRSASQGGALVKPELTLRMKLKDLKLFNDHHDSGKGPSVDQKDVHAKDPKAGDTPSFANITSRVLKQLAQPQQDIGSCQAESSGGGQQAKEGERKLFIDAETLEKLLCALIPPSEDHGRDDPDRYGVGNVLVPLERKGSAAIVRPGLQHPRVGTRESVEKCVKDLVTEAVHAHLTAPSSERKSSRVVSEWKFGDGERRRRQTAGSQWASPWNPGIGGRLVCSRSCSFMISRLREEGGEGNGSSSNESTRKASSNSNLKAWTDVENVPLDIQVHVDYLMAADKREDEDRKGHLSLKKTNRSSNQKSGVNVLSSGSKLRAGVKERLPLRLEHLIACRRALWGTSWKCDTLVVKVQAEKELSRLRIVESELIPSSSGPTSTAVNSVSKPQMLAALWKLRDLIERILRLPDGCFLLDLQKAPGSWAKGRIER